MTVRRGPSLAKAPPPPLVSHAMHHVRGSEGRWRDLFATADAISEGSVKHEVTGPTWYGSTSVILALPPGTPEREKHFLAAFAACDVHVRLRALRLAQREAQVRAPGALGRGSCEIRVSGEAQGVRIDIDIQAPLIERRKTLRRV